MAGAGPRNVAARTDFILGIGLSVRVRMNRRAGRAQKGLSASAGLSNRPACFRKVRHDEQIPIPHAIPAKHCGTLDMADNKSQIL
jgi:hypothetical protein